MASYKRALRDIDSLQELNKLHETGQRGPEYDKLFAKFKKLLAKWADETGNDPFDVPAFLAFIMRFGHELSRGKSPKQALTVASRDGDKQDSGRRPGTNPDVPPAGGPGQPGPLPAAARAAVDRFNLDPDLRGLVRAADDVELMRGRYGITHDMLARIVTNQLDRRDGLRKPHAHMGPPNPGPTRAEVLRADGRPPDQGAGDEAGDEAADMPRGLPADDEDDDEDEVDDADDEDDDDGQPPFGRRRGFAAALMHRARAPPMQQVMGALIDRSVTAAERRRRRPIPRPRYTQRMNAEAVAALWDIKPGGDEDVQLDVDDAEEEKKEELAEDQAAAPRTAKPARFGVPALSRGTMVAFLTRRHRLGRHAAQSIAANVHDMQEEVREGVLERARGVAGGARVLASGEEMGESEAAVRFAQSVFDHALTPPQARVVLQYLNIAEGDDTVDVNGISAIVDQNHGVRANDLFSLATADALARVGVGERDSLMSFLVPVMQFMMNEIRLGLFFQVATPHPEAQARAVGVDLPPIAPMLSPALPPGTELARTEDGEIQLIHPDREQEGRIQDRIRRHQMQLRLWYDNHEDTSEDERADTRGEHSGLRLKTTAAGAANQQAMLAKAREQGRQARLAAERPRPIVETDSSSTDFEQPRKRRKQPPIHDEAALGTQARRTVERSELGAEALAALDSPEAAALAPAAQGDALDAADAPPEMKQEEEEKEGYSGFHRAMMDPLGAMLVTDVPADVPTTVATFILWAGTEYAADHVRLDPVLEEGKTIEGMRNFIRQRLTHDEGGALRIIRELGEDWVEGVRTILGHIRQRTIMRPGTMIMPDGYLRAYADAVFWRHEAQERLRSAERRGDLDEATQKMQQAIGRMEQGFGELVGNPTAFHQSVRHLYKKLTQARGRSAAARAAVPPPATGDVDRPPYPVPPREFAAGTRETIYHTADPFGDAAQAEEDAEPLVALAVDGGVRQRDMADVRRLILGLREAAFGNQPALHDVDITNPARAAQGRFTEGRPIADAWAAWQRGLVEGLTGPPPAIVGANLFGRLAMIVLAAAHHVARNPDVADVAQRRAQFNDVLAAAINRTFGPLLPEDAGLNLGLVIERLASVFMHVNWTEAAPHERPPRGGIGRDLTDGALADVATHVQRWRRLDPEHIFILAQEITAETTPEDVERALIWTREVGVRVGTDARLRAWVQEEAAPWAEAAMGDLRPARRAGIAGEAIRWGLRQFFLAGRLPGVVHTLEATIMATAGHVPQAHAQGPDLALWPGTGPDLLVGAVETGPRRRVGSRQDRLEQAASHARLRAIERRLDVGRAVRRGRQGQMEAFIVEAGLPDPIMTLAAVIPGAQYGYQVVEALIHVGVPARDAHEIVERAANEVDRELTPGARSRLMDGLDTIGLLVAALAHARKAQDNTTIVRYLADQGWPRQIYLHGALRDTNLTHLQAARAVIFAVLLGVTGMGNTKKARRVAEYVKDEVWRDPDDDGPDGGAARDVFLRLSAAKKLADQGTSAKAGEGYPSSGSGAGEKGGKKRAAAGRTMFRNRRVDRAGADPLTTLRDVPEQTQAAPVRRPARGTWRHMPHEVLPDSGWDIRQIIDGAVGTGRLPDGSGPILDDFVNQVPRQPPVPDNDGGNKDDDALIIMLAALGVNPVVKTDDVPPKAPAEPSSPFRESWMGGKLTGGALLSGGALSRLHSARVREASPRQLLQHVGRDMDADHLHEVRDHIRHVDAVGRGSHGFVHPDLGAALHGFGTSLGRVPARERGRAHLRLNNESANDVHHLHERLKREHGHPNPDVRDAVKQIVRMVEDGGLDIHGAHDALDHLRGMQRPVALPLRRRAHNGEGAHSGHAFVDESGRYRDDAHHGHDLGFHVQVGHEDEHHRVTFPGMQGGTLGRKRKTIKAGMHVPQALAGIFEDNDRDLPPHLRGGRSKMQGGLHEFVAVPFTALPQAHEMVDGVHGTTLVGTLGNRFQRGERTPAEHKPEGLSRALHQLHVQGGHHKAWQMPGRPDHLAGGGLFDFFEDVGDWFEGAGETVIDGVGYVGRELGKATMSAGKSIVGAVSDMGDGIAHGAKDMTSFFDHPSWENLGESFKGLGEIGLAVGRGSLNLGGRGVHALQGIPGVNVVNAGLMAAIPGIGLAETALSVGADLNQGNMGDALKDGMMGLVLRGAGKALKSAGSGASVVAGLAG